MNQRIRFVSWCLCGNLFRLFRTRLECSAHIRAEYSATELSVKLEVWTGAKPLTCEKAVDIDPAEHFSNFPGPGAKKLFKPVCF